MFENKTYINDHLEQEFSERVSKKRKLLLYTQLSQTLKHFEVPVSPQEEEAENELVAKAVQEKGEVCKQQPDLREIIRRIGIMSAQEADDIGSG